MRFIFFQSNNTLVIDMAISYLRICCCIPFGMVFFSCFEKLLQATGKSLFSTIAQVSGAVTNIILDPILIYGLFGCPALGVRGAAYATVLGQIVSCIVALFFHLAINKEIANGLYYKIQQFLLFAAFGLRDAITPIVSFNYGMRNKQRVNLGIKYGMLYTLVIMLAGTVLLELFASPLAHVFGLSGETEQLCVSAIRIISLSLVFAGINVAGQGVFQALRSGIESLVISLCRQLIFVLPVAWLFARIGLRIHMPSLIWWTFLLAETISVALFCVLMRRIRRSKIACI